MELLELPSHTVVTNESGDDDLAARVVASIREVYDPEIPVNILDLGLIYLLHIKEDKSVFIRMTLTAPNCPAAGILPDQVRTAAGLTEDITDSHVELTFDPPFTMEMMSDEAKLSLGFL